MRKYLVNNSEVSKAEWQARFLEFPEATVILRTNQFKSLAEEAEQIFAKPVSPERAQQIRRQHD